MVTVCSLCKVKRDAMLSSGVENSGEWVCFVIVVVLVVKLKKVT